MIDDILEFNKKFVESKGYEKYITNKYPDKKIAILSCMDTRLTELLPAALGIRNGDVKIIKNGLSGNFWLVSFKISYLCLPLFYETRTTPSCHPSGCAYRQL